MVIMTTDTGTYSAHEMSASLVVCHVCHPRQPLTRTATALWQQQSTRAPLRNFTEPTAYWGTRAPPEKPHAVRILHTRRHTLQPLKASACFS